MIPDDSLLQKKIRGLMWPNTI